MKRSAVMFIAIGGPKAHVTLGIGRWTLGKIWIASGLRILPDLFGIGGCKLLICFRISGAIQILSLARASPQRVEGEEDRPAPANGRDCSAPASCLERGRRSGFVPDPEQRLWRTVTRTKYQLTQNRVQLQNRLEALLEEAHIKLFQSSLGFARHQRTAHAAGAGRGGDRPGGSGRAGQLSLARHAGTVARRTRRMPGA